MREWGSGGSEGVGVEGGERGMGCKREGKMGFY